MDCTYRPLVRVSPNGDSLSFSFGGARDVLWIVEVCRRIACDHLDFDIPILQVSGDFKLCQRMVEGCEMVWGAWGADQANG
jgi:hypothetical protein